MPARLARVWVSVRTWTWRCTSTAIAGSAKCALVSAARARRSARRTRREAIRPGLPVCRCEARTWRRTCSRRAADSTRTRRVAASAATFPSAARRIRTRTRSTGRNQASPGRMRSACWAVWRVSRRENSNRVAAMTGVSANASYAPGRSGAWIQLNRLDAATRPHTASRGATADSPRAARRISRTAHNPAAPSREPHSR